MDTNKHIKNWTAPPSPNRTRSIIKAKTLDTSAAPFTPSWEQQSAVINTPNSLFIPSVEDLSVSFSRNLALERSNSAPPGDLRRYMFDTENSSEYLLFQNDNNINRMFSFLDSNPSLPDGRISNDDVYFHDNLNDGSSPFQLPSDLDLDDVGDSKFDKCRGNIEFVGSNSQIDVNSNRQSHLVSDSNRLVASSPLYPSEGSWQRVLTPSFGSISSSISSTSSSNTGPTPPSIVASSNGSRLSNVIGITTGDDVLLSIDEGRRAPRPSLVDRIQADFPRTPSPVYASVPGGVPNGDFTFESMADGVSLTEPVTNSTNGSITLEQQLTKDDYFISNIKTKSPAVFHEISFGRHIIPTVPSAFKSKGLNSNVFHYDSGSVGPNGKVSNVTVGSGHSRPSKVLGPMGNHSYNLGNIPDSIILSRNQLVVHESTSSTPIIHEISERPHSYGLKSDGPTAVKTKSKTESRKAVDQFSTRKIDHLPDVAGHVVEFSSDQHGSRFIQQHLEVASATERQAVFDELLPHALRLTTDVFGNYVIQKFFEHGLPDQRRLLAASLRGNVLSLSLQMYGCRVVQKALEHVGPAEQRALVSELDGHVLRCVRDQNGNHVIQKCIESVPVSVAPFVIGAFRGQVSSLATHPYGCRVIQRVLEHGEEVDVRPLMLELLTDASSLVQDQYGNYVVQHVLERGRPSDRHAVICRIQGSVLQYSRHKFASNVVEKCVAYGSKEDRQTLIEEVLEFIPSNEQQSSNDLNDGNDRDDLKNIKSFPLLLMMRDQYANYVVQRMLDVVNGEQRELLLSRIRPHLPSLRRITYGKHILAKVDNLLGLEQNMSHANASSAQKLVQISINGSPTLPTPRRKL